MSANNFTWKRKKKMTNNNTVKTGDTVTLHYRGTFEDGTEFDSSHSRGEPITVTAGVGQLISGFDTALDGMTAGTTKTVTIPPEQAYGDKNPAAFTTLNRSLFPDGFEFVVDKTVPLMGSNGEPVMGTISELTDDEIIVDLNHPMAGKTLNFEIEVVSVTDTAEEDTDDETTAG
jgi:peptidylprolyl isomerase